MPVEVLEGDVGIDAIEGTDRESALRASEQHDPTPPKATPEPTEPAKPAAEPAKPAAKEPAKVSEPVKPVDDLESLRPKATPKTDVPETPKQLRDQYEKTKAELAALRDRLKESETGTESAKTKAAEEARSEFQKKIEQLQKERDEREEQIKIADYAKSTEFKERYAKPIADAWEQVRTDLKDVKYISPDGTDRPATDEDIANLCRMSARDAHRVAAERYGSDATLALEKRSQILGLYTAAEKAKSDFQARAKDIEVQSVTQAKERVNQFTSAITSVQKQYADLFGEIDGDKDVSEMVKSGNTLIRSAFVGDNLPSDMTPQAREEAIIKAQVMTAVRAAGFGRQTLLLNRANSRITELEEKLKQYEKSDPPPGGDSAAETTPKTKTGAEGIDDIPGVDFLGQ